MRYNSNKYKPTLVKLDVIMNESTGDVVWIARINKYITLEMKYIILHLLLVLKRIKIRVPKFVLFIIFGFAI